MLRVWNATLVALAFCLSIFGTFLTRSGLINSIHSFAQSPIGAWFLGFICRAAAFSTALIVCRLPLLRARTRLESLASREAAFLYNNLLLVAFTLTILWGVAFPLLSEAVRGEAVTVGPPYYDFFLKTFGLPLLLLMGIGPLVAWRRTSARALLERVRCDEDPALPHRGHDADPQLRPDLPRQRAAPGGEPPGDPRADRGQARRKADRNAARGEEPLLRGGPDVERGRDPQRLAAG